MMAAVGAAALGVDSGAASPGTRAISARVACVGAVAAVVVGAGAAVPFVLNFIPEPKPTAREAAIGKRQPAVQFAVGPVTRSRCSPRAWCSPSSTSGRG